MAASVHHVEESIENTGFVVQLLCSADYTVIQTKMCVQTVSGFPETVVETVVLTQEDSLKNSSGQKKKNRERGKVWTFVYYFPT